MKLESMQQAIKQVLAAETAAQVISIVDEVDRCIQSGEMIASADDWPKLSDAVHRQKEGDHHSQT
jgi:hypothetical protein